MVFFITIPSSISGGKPPTNTFLENRSPLSDPCDGDERAGDPICKLFSKKFPPLSQFVSVVSSH